MYPNLYYAFKDLFGIELQGLKMVNSFGFFVAMCFLSAAWVITQELKRKQKQGHMVYTEQKIKVGAPADFLELTINFFLGFVLGFKIIGAFLISEALQDPPSFIFSSNGHWPMGIVMGLVFGGLKWWEKKKQQLAVPEERIIRVWPHDRVGDMVIFAAISGFIGAKIFHNLENWNEFIKDPIGNLVAFSGLTFYGGLIMGTLAVIYYARKYKMPVIHLADAIAPGLMLGYAIGRIGCQVSGDGDWGIVNSSPKPFSWLPDSFWAYQYPHNVLNEGVPIPGCVGEYCNQLPQAVFPTPLYESITCLLLFGVLWFLRTRIQIAGRLTAVYLMMNGVERFLIEKIRVNTTYNFGSFQPTQAEIISTVLFLGGVVLYVYAPKLKAKA
jgi:prolipoprotein diacylglyceryl transferase